MGISPRIFPLFPTLLIPLIINKLRDYQLIRCDYNMYEKFLAEFI